MLLYGVHHMSPNVRYAFVVCLDFLSSARECVIEREMIGGGVCKELLEHLHAQRHL